MNVLGEEDWCWASREELYFWNLHVEAYGLWITGQHMTLKTYGFPKLGWDYTKIIFPQREEKIEDLQYDGDW